MSAVRGPGPCPRRAPPLLGVFSCPLKVTRPKPAGGWGRGCCNRAPLLLPSPSPQADPPGLGRGQDCQVRVRVLLGIAVESPFPAPSAPGPDLPHLGTCLLRWTLLSLSPCHSQPVPGSAPRCPQPSHVCSPGHGRAAPARPPRRPGSARSSPVPGGPEHPKRAA